MRLLHTSDWHLGQRLHERDRSFEHGRFLEWLLALLERERVDALLLAGDVFDVAHPGPEATRLWYRWLARLAGACPGLDLVVVGGNHDSAARLEAPRELISALGGFHVVGCLPRDGAGALDVERLVVPLHDAAGRVAAWCLALPYLRPCDLPAAAELRERLGRDADVLLDGTRLVYDEALRAALARREAGQALVATGHCYLAGGTLSEKSERRIQRGNQEALPCDLYGPELAYVALGHLHKAQRVGGEERLRYSGSPIPLALSERGYRHQVVLVELEGERLRSVRPVEVPRSVDFLRVPDEGALGSAELIAALAALPLLPDPPPPLEQRAFLEVAARVDAPWPSLRRDVERALEGRLPLLSWLHKEEAKGAASAVLDRSLAELTPEDVFRRCWSLRHPGEPPRELLAGFAELVELAQAEERA